MPTHSFATSVTSVLTAPSMACTSAIYMIAQKTTPMSPVAMRLVKMPDQTWWEVSGWFNDYRILWTRKLNSY